MGTWEVVTRQRYKVANSSKANCNSILKLPTIAPVPCQVEVQAHYNSIVRFHIPKHASERTTKAALENIHYNKWQWWDTFKSNSDPATSWKPKMKEPRTQRENEARKDRLASQNESAITRVVQMEQKLQAIKIRQACANRHPTESANQVKQHTINEDVVAHELPMPTGWTSNKNNEYDILGLVNTTINNKLKWNVINGSVRTGIADAGASVLCGKSDVSECGKYTLNGDPFIPTGKMSDRILQYNDGSLATADKTTQLHCAL